MIDYAAVRSLIALMRETGATRIRCEGLEVELGPAPVAAPEPVKEEKPEPEPVCACGCEWAVHNEAGCGNGCSLERCGDAPQKEPSDEPI